MKTVLLLLGLIAPLSLCAQEGHVCAITQPKTQIGAFEERTGTIMVKGINDVGIIGCAAGSISVAAKETTDISSTQKVFGASVTLKGRDRASDVRLLDYEELESLSKAIGRINGALWGDTSMASFEGVWTSKDGLRVVTFSNRATGAIESAIQTVNGFPMSLSMSTAQLESFRALVEQAKARVDSIRVQTIAAAK